jgi:U3 small nucleolar RNA-associated protein 14
LIKQPDKTKGNDMSKPSLATMAIDSKKEELAVAKAAVVTLRKELAELRATRKNFRAELKAKKAADKVAAAAARAEKKSARIAKLEAKLLALKTGPVGIKAIKANRKPSKVKITKVA